MKKAVKILIISIIIILILLYIITFYCNKKIDNSLKTIRDLKYNINDKITCVQNKKYITEVICDFERKPGTYQATYKAKYFFIKKELTKKITIIDNVKPIINLKENEVILYEGEEYQEPGYTAIDNVDGDITRKVIIESNLNTKEQGTYYITYLVTDSSGNYSDKKTRKIIIKEKEIVKKNIYLTTITNKGIINQYIKELDTYFSKYNVSIGYLNLKNGFTYTYKPNTIYFGASLIKTVDAMYLYEKNILNNNLKNKIKKAISVSDNSAHEYLVNYIGIKKLKEYASSIGVTNLNCNSKFYCNTTVNDQINILIHLNNLIKKLENGSELKSYFINKYINYLSYDKTYTNLHKYGNTSPYFHDVGIFDTDNPYIIVVLTKENIKTEKNVANLIRNISLKINKLNNLVESY